MTTNQEEGVCRIVHPLMSSVHSLLWKTGEPEFEEALDIALEHTREMFNKSDATRLEVFPVLYGNRDFGEDDFVDKIHITMFTKDHCTKAWLSSDYAELADLLAFSEQRKDREFNVWRKPNKEIVSFNENIITNGAVFREYILADHDDVFEPLVDMVANYIIYSGLYDDVTVYLDKAEDVAEVVGHGRSYFIEAIYMPRSSEDLSTKALEIEVVNFAFASLQAAAQACIEMRQQQLPTVIEEPLLTDE